eukprot:gene20563-28993_t
MTSQQMRWETRLREEEERKKDQQQTLQTLQRRLMRERAEREQQADRRRRGSSPDKRKRADDAAGAPKPKPPGANRNPKDLPEGIDQVVKRLAESPDNEKKVLSFLTTKYNADKDAQWQLQFLVPEGVGHELFTKKLEKAKKDHVDCSDERRAPQAAALLLRLAASRPPWSSPAAGAKLIVNAFFEQ